jgi:hypothetical protein
MEGLKNLRTIGGNLTIGSYWGGNQSLTTLSGLDSVSYVGGDINIESNVSLTNIRALQHIDPQQITALIIRRNSLLSECEITSVCKYLENPTGFVEVNFNSQGCNSQAEVLLACNGNGVTSGEIGRDKLWPNPAGETLFFDPGSNLSEYVVTITSLTGEQLITTGPQTGPATIDLGNLQKGIYFATITRESGNRTFKLIRK